MAGVPNVAAAYLGAGENAGHKLNYNSKVVADSSSATLPQGSRMPCTECHVVHGKLTSSIYMFSEVRTGAPVVAIRDLCEGCHLPFDSGLPAPVVAGMTIRKLPGSVTDHGSASSRPCSDCHGSTGHDPQGHGGAASCIDCHGTSGSHPIHLSATDKRGPGGMACGGCHDTGDYPYFSGGADSDASGHIELDETTACDACHSPGGSYNGVDSAGQSIGAKDNWDSRVYQTSSSLQAGKEKWCAGCHDSAPALIGGVYAPPVIGNESAAYIYGTGYGFYKTGHGVPASSKIPSNGFKPGAGLECDACHDYLQTHVDGERRTYDKATSSTAYRTSYRLDMVGGSNPMEIPWTGGAANDASRARLCYQSGCHAYSQINNTAVQQTNFWLSGGTYYNLVWRYNMHEFHLNFDHQLRWVSDYSTFAYPGDSQISCPTCHNVHGSQYLAMTQDGELISDAVERRPGLRMWYRKTGVSVFANDPNPPAPQDIPLAASDGWVFAQGTSASVCSHCHGNNNTLGFTRNLWENLGTAPILSWTGQPGYTSDGADPDSGSALDTFTFRINYTDGNNDAPSYVVLLIDRNDDGDYGDLNESVPMNPDNASDTTYYNGNGYNVAIQLAKAGDNVLNYRFEASDGVTGVSTTDVKTVTVTNAVPQLPWTGETGYADDGVNPNSGTSDITSYEFRVMYRDGDGEAPSGGAPSLYVDKNDDGDYDDAGEVVVMSAMSGGDYVSGKRFNHTTTLSYVGDGVLPYYFSASDGTASVQTAVSTVTVLENVNQAPVLAWTAETNYVADGVDPENQAGRKPFYFRVQYTDANNDAPGIRQVWVDLDDNGSYGAGEKITMDDAVTASNPTKTDGDYSNGEFFAEKVYIPYAGDGTIKYCFYFTDSAADATGVQLVDRNLSVYKANYVHLTEPIPSPNPPTVGDGVYRTIQAAVTASLDGQTVLVADGNWAGFAYNGKDITVDSVNGSGSTFIQGSGTLVDFNNTAGGSNSTLRGFTVRNGTVGVSSNGSDVVIQQCVIENNSAQGINHLSGNLDPLVVEDSVIRNNHPGVQTTNSGAVMTLRRTAVTGNSVAGSGAGILSGGGNYTLESCTLSDNIAGASGGALYNSNAAFVMVMRDSVLEGNRANGGGGGALAFNAAGTVTVERTILRGNRASANGGAVWHQGGRYNFTNSTFSGNYAVGNGGGVMMATNTGYPTFNSCTFSGNSAGLGGGLYVSNPVDTADRPKVLNCIMYGDDARSSVVLEEIDGTGAGYLARTQVQYTDIMQDFTVFNSQIGNINASPQFVAAVAASSAPTNSGDYHIQTGSPCEGAASASYAPADDIDRGARPQGTGYDMGSDEIGASAIASLHRTILGLRDALGVGLDGTPKHEGVASLYALPGGTSQVQVTQVAGISAASVVSKAPNGTISPSSDTPPVEPLSGTLALVLVASGGGLLARFFPLVLAFLRRLAAR